MVSFLIVTIISIILFLILFLLATLDTYGWFISKMTTNVFMNLDTTKLKLNPYNRSIISTDPFINRLPIPLLSKYYINGLGQIPRWSKLHKKINEYYKIAEQNEKQKDIKTRFLVVFNTKIYRYGFLETVWTNKEVCDNLDVKIYTECLSKESSKEMSRQLNERI
jgi:hypothetical protein